MKLNKKIIVSLVICLGVFSSSVFASEIKDADKEIINVNGKKLTNQNLYDSMMTNASYAPYLDVLDYKFLTEKYKGDERLKKIIDSNYAQMEEANKDMKNIFALFGVDNKADYLKKSGVELAAYRELAAMDTAYDKIFTNAEKDYIYENRFSGQGKIYHILLSPKISANDANDESKINEAKAEALQRGEEVVSKLDGGASFSDMVKQYSDDRLTENGLIGDYNINSAREANLDPNVIPAVFKLKNKEYSNPIETDYGYEIVYIEYSKEKQSAEELRNDIARILYDMYQGNNQNTANYAVMMYRQNNGINFKDNVLSRTYANSFMQARKSFLQFDPNQQNQYANYGY